ncbi:MAG: hypothetical protein ACYCYR_06405 [Desulfobulbaceae bacterium]
MVSQGTASSFQAVDVPRLATGKPLHEQTDDFRMIAGADHQVWIWMDIRQ